MNKYIFNAFIILLISSCGTIIDGNKQQIAFDSNEKDVEIYIDSELICKTPCIANIRRKNKRLMISAKKQSFEDKTIFLDKNINSSAAFNVISLWTSTFGASTDVITGGMWAYQPNSIYIVMTHTPRNTVEKKQQIQQNKIRDFVLRNFDHLQSDLWDATSSEEYINTLTTISGISTTQIKEVLKSSYAAPDCAERIVGAYLSK